MSGILSGIRVLDFGRYIAGPFCAALLADHGAEVIRVEPASGSDDRYVMPITAIGEGALYIQTNRNKKSLTLNLEKPQAVAILRQLISASDIVVASLGPAALRRAGLDYDTLKGIKPDIILTTISAFDPAGPNRNAPGFDGTGQAYSGGMYLTGMPGQPFRSAVSYVDYSTALAAAFGTMTALMARAQTGHGQHVQAALVNTALTMTNPMLMEEASGARSRSAMGNRSPISGPSDLFPTLDGWILVQVAGQNMFERWCKLMHTEEFIKDRRFESDLSRGENGQVLSEVMMRWCESKTTRESLDTLRTSRIPGCEVLSPAQVVNQARDSGNGLFEWQNRAGLTCAVPVLRAPVSLSTVSMAPAKPAPYLGEHTAEVLRTLGFSDDDVATLMRDGVV